MANTAKATKSGRKVGRPSNADLAARAQASQANLIRIVAQAASSAAEGAVRAALGNGTVTTLTPSTPTTGARKSPGRPREANSLRSQAFDLYAANSKKLARKDIVNKMVEDLGLKKNVANTYYHEAEIKAGDRIPKTKASKAA